MTVNASDWKAIAVEDADLPERAVRALAAAGVATLGQIDAMSDVELVRIRDLGRMQMWRARERIDTIRRDIANRHDDTIPVADRLDDAGSYVHRLGDAIRGLLTPEQMYVINRDIGDPDHIAGIIAACAAEIREDAT